MYFKLEWCQFSYSATVGESVVDRTILHILAVYPLLSDIDFYRDRASVSHQSVACMSLSSALIPNS